MVKVVTLFLIAMALLAIFGRLRLSDLGKSIWGARCQRCGKRLAGKARCDCGKGAA